MDYKRPHFEKLLKRIGEPRKFMQVVTGPWQEFITLDPVELF